MSSSRRNASRRFAALTLVLSLGALPLASAEAAHGSRRDSTIRQTSPLRTLMETWWGSLLSVVEKNGSHPGNKPGNGASEASPEGSGICPNGKPGPQGNPNQSGI